MNQHYCKLCQSEDARDCLPVCRKCFNSIGELDSPKIDFRAAVLATLASRDRTIYWLAKESNVPYARVRKWLKEEQESIAVKYLESILHTLTVRLGKAK